MKRLPRPQGLTYITNQYRVNQITKEQYCIKVLEYYIFQNHEFNKTIYKLYEIANMLNIELSVCQGLYFKVVGNIAKGTSSQDVIQGLLIKNLEMAAQNNHEIMASHRQNLEDLSTKMAADFKWYKVKDYNQALQGITGAAGNQLSLLKILMQGSGPKTAIQINQNSGTSPSQNGQEYLTVESANFLLSSTSNSAEIPLKEGRLFPLDENINPYISEPEIPEVRANLQNKVETDGLLENPLTKPTSST